MSRSRGFVVAAVGLVACCITMHVSSAADVVLNEYNAVSGSNQLDDGDGADSFFGLIDGNGGNWFELLVVGDHVDMRGWQMAWAEDEVVEGGGTAAGTLTLSNADIWSDIRAGSIVTFIETVDAGEVGDFNTDTDISYDPMAGDWWINVSTQSEAAKGADALVTSVTNDGDAGDFSVGKDDWTLTILDSAGTTIFGPVGEGAATWAGDGVGSREGGSLEGPGVDENGVVPTLEAWQAIGPDSSLYDDTGATSFGMANVDYDGDSMTFTTIQDLSALRALVVTPLNGDGDFDGDGQVTANDIDLLTAAVGTPGADLRFDLDGDGQVAEADRTAWVERAAGTFFGDANLDGEFSSADLVVVLTAGQYEDAVAGNSTWATGDWDGDGDFTTSDFVKALSGGGYEVGPRAATAAVPEPSGMLCLAIGGLLAFVRRRLR